MSQLLTIAISEMDPHKYKVITYDLNEGDYKSLNIEKRDFFKNEKPVWDMFAVTEADVIPDRGELFKVVGEPTFIQNKTPEEMTALFEKLQISARRFYSNSNIRYGVVKIGSVDRLNPPEKNNRIKQRVDFTSKGFERTGVLIKDYQWLTYWEKLHEEQWEEKLNHWLAYFNKPEVNVYVVMYCHHFKRNFNRWISGFHCL
ncbi:hypothetical protein [Bacillus sp. Marseille-P3661]|uniref:hypothetical protein n=1 Tax=Bacillus sp. Marseille-P3661 TaxID=1936234 RepID=UPI000C822A10|nr:hypothetical protein [Bacillus sp. Marseille-P3661]